MLISGSEESTVQKSRNITFFNVYKKTKYTHEKCFNIKYTEAIICILVFISIYYHLKNTREFRPHLLGVCALPQLAYSAWPHAYRVHARPPYRTEPPGYGHGSGSVSRPPSACVW